jgi:hypothetical protein
MIEKLGAEIATLTGTTAQARVNAVPLLNGQPGCGSLLSATRIARKTATCFCAALRA